MGRSIFLGRNHPQICRDLCILNPFSDLFFAFKYTISRHFAGYASVALETIWLHEPRDLIFSGPLMTLLSNIGTLHYTTLQRLQRIQNCAARLITRTRKYEHITPVLRPLHWLPVRQRTLFKLLVLTYCAVNATAPNYLVQLLHRRNVSRTLKPGVHTNDFAPIHRLRALTLGHASLATVFRPGRLTLQPILRENLESPVLRYQPITTAVVTDACLNTRWHHGAYT